MIENKNSNDILKTKIIKNITNNSLKNIYNHSNKFGDKSLSTRSKIDSSNLGLSSTNPQQQNDLTNKTSIINFENSNLIKNSYFLNTSHNKKKDSIQSPYEDISQIEKNTKFGILSTKIYESPAVHNDYLELQDIYNDELRYSRPTSNLMRNNTENSYLIKSGNRISTDRLITNDTSSLPRYENGSMTEATPANKIQISNDNETIKNFIYYKNDIKNTNLSRKDSYGPFSPRNNTEKETKNQIYPVKNRNINFNLNLTAQKVQLNEKFDKEMYSMKFKESQKNFKTNSKAHYLLGSFNSNHTERQNRNTRPSLSSEKFKTFDKNNESQFIINKKVSKQFNQIENEQKFTFPNNQIPHEKTNNPNSNQSDTNIPDETSNKKSTPNPHPKNPTKTTLKKSPKNYPETIEKKINKIVNSVNNMSKHLRQGRVYKKVQKNLDKVQTDFKNIHTKYITEQDPMILIHRKNKETAYIKKILVLYIFQRLKNCPEFEHFGFANKVKIQKHFAEIKFSK